MAQTITKQGAWRSRRSQRFYSNVLWGWLGVAVNLLVGIVLSRYIVRQLGPERYGIWVLVFSLLDNLWIFDLGLNTAVTNFCARYLATGEPQKINDVINTSLFYFTLLGMALVCLTVLLSGRVAGFFQISPAHQHEFSTLVLLTGVSWALSIILLMFVSALDGFQRFDLTNRVQVVILVLRNSGYAITLAMGYGLVEMGIVFVSAQSLSYLWHFMNFRRVFRELRFSIKMVKLSVFREILNYGLRSFLANSSSMLLIQSAPIAIGHYMASTAFVGFYALPSRLLQYAVEAVSRIGMVTRSSAAEMEASGHKEDVLRLGIYANRYSFTLFMPLTLALIVYGRELMNLWMGTEFAVNSTPLLPVLTISTAMVAGQFNSSSILFGINRHGGYARGLIFEAVANVVGMIIIVPRFGILGAAWVASILMILNRGFYTPWLVCHALRCPFINFMRLIYLRPLLTAIPVLLIAYLGKFYWLSGNTWPELIIGSGTISLLYAALAFLTSIEPEHRVLFISGIPYIGTPLRNALDRA